MSDFAGLIILLAVCWFLQVGLTYIQYQNYQKKLNEIKRRKDGYLGVGIARAKFKIGKGVIVLLVTDEENTVLDYQQMSGVTTFARFKRREDWIGKKTKDLLPLIKNSQQRRAFDQATDLIHKELLKMEVV